MAATASSVPFVPLSDYLGHPFHPDVDYVDGVLDERNLGEFDHSRLQGALFVALMAFEKELDARAMVELRVQVAPTRFRIPDVCLIPASSKTPVVQVAPLLCVEVLSSEDRLPRMRTRCEDYLQMGVGMVWIFDPASRTAYELDGSGLRELKADELRLEGATASLSIAKIFEVLDR